MSLDDYKTEAPIDEPENNCFYCGDPCENVFCNDECRKAERND